MYKRLPKIKESQAELAELLRTERNAELRPRLHLLLLLASGAARSRSQAASHLALHRNTVSNYLTIYEEHGLERLLCVRPGGRPPGPRNIPAPVVERLNDLLAAEGFEGYTDVHRWMVDEQGVEVPYSTLYKFVRYRLGAKLKRARPSHAKKTSRTQPSFPAG